MSVRSIFNSLNILVLATLIVCYNLIDFLEWPSYEMDAEDIRALSILKQQGFFEYHPDFEKGKFIGIK